LYCAEEDFLYFAMPKKTPKTQSIVKESITEAREKKISEGKKKKRRRQKKKRTHDATQKKDKAKVHEIAKKTKEDKQPKSKKRKTREPAEEEGGETAGAEEVVDREQGEDLEDPPLPRFKVEGTEEAELGRGVVPIRLVFDLNEAEEPPQSQPWSKDDTIWKLAAFVTVFSPPTPGRVVDSRTLASNAGRLRHLFDSYDTRSMQRDMMFHTALSAVGAVNFCFLRTYFLQIYTVGDPVDDSTLEEGHMRWCYVDHCLKNPPDSRRRLNYSEYVQQFFPQNSDEEDENEEDEYKEDENEDEHEGESEDESEEDENEGESEEDESEDESEEDESEDENEERPKKRRRTQPKKRKKTPQQIARFVKPILEKWSKCLLEKEEEEATVIPLFVDTNVDNVDIDQV
jgi:hypothetical protein